MIIWWGQRLYGKVDVVPGLFHVATRFFYIQFIPLVPTASFLVIAGTNDESGVPISMSFKSVLVAWLRAVLVCAIGGSIALAIIGGIDYSKHAQLGMEMLVGGGAGLALSIFLYWASVRFTRAGIDRALELADQLGIDRKVVEQCFAQTIEPPEETSNWYDSTSDGR